MTKVSMLIPGKKVFFSSISWKFFGSVSKKIASKTKNGFSNCLALNFYMKEGKGTMFVDSYYVFKSVKYFLTCPKTKIFSKSVRNCIPIKSAIKMKRIRVRGQPQYVRIE